MKRHIGERETEITCDNFLLIDNYIVRLMIIKSSNYQ